MLNSRLCFLSFMWDYIWIMLESSMLFYILIDCREIVNLYEHLVVENYSLLTFWIRMTLLVNNDEIEEIRKLERDGYVDPEDEPLAKHRSPINL